ncbi:TIGR02281 family clan AA aspartic protease [Pseudogemmobacter sp. W21_MBD1_M6]|uniref:TIGR02281 family clan AA aspartic protease n=1 Tax=Pseudogemmobacter sp. W21_MBD1_M6 TaxID=3240271 RepID=UPI003F9E75F7
MTSDDIGRLIYLVLLAAVIGGYFFARNRQSLGRTMQQASVWGLIFIGAVAVIGLWGDISKSVMPRQSVITGENRVEVPRAPDGHYYLVLDVNNTPVRFVVDTGATEVVLRQEDARRVGLDPADMAFIGQANTANGIVRTARVRLDRVNLGGIVDTRLPAWVSEGEMRESLLGMTYLSRFSKLSIEGGTLVLQR